MQAELTHAMFAEWLHTKFVIQVEHAAPLEVELIEASKLRAEPGRGGRPAAREPFSLVFRGPMQPWVPQRLYTMKHEHMGAADLFLVAIGPDEVGMRYEALFN
jgi:hypothetical protein